MFRKAVLFVLVAAVLLSGIVLVPKPVNAAEVSVTLIAQNFQWHVGTATSTDTAIRAAVGDTVRLRIENRDSGAGGDHTFTAPQFPFVAGQGGGDNFLNFTLAPGAVAFWNFTLRAGDLGTWQYYCLPHSSGTYPNRAVMVGSFTVSAAAVPPTPSDNTLLIVGGVIAVVIIVAAAAVMMRKRGPKAPRPPQPP